jgi:hypothetical protein
MDYINIILNSLSIILFMVAGLTAVTNIIVEVFKGMFPKLPTNILVFIVSIGITILALFIAAAVLEITVMWYYAVGAVILGIFVAYAAMGNFDKLKETFESLKEYRK